MGYRHFPGLQHPPLDPVLTVNRPKSNQTLTKVRDKVKDWGVVYRGRGKKVARTQSAVLSPGLLTVSLQDAEQDPKGLEDGGRGPRP